MRISKKILACVLAALMALTMMPFTAFAATVSVATGAELKTAIANAASGDVIEFSADNTTYPATSGALVIPVDGKDITIDLKGHTQYFRVSGETTVSYPTDLFVLENGAKLTVKDSVGGGAIYATYGGNSSAYIFNVLDSSDLVIDGGTFVMDAANYGGVIVYQNSADASTTINEGTFTANTGAKARRDYIINNTRGDVEINGGEFSTPRSFDYIVNAGNTADTNVTINDGDFEGTINGTTGKVVINGGTFKTFDGAVNDISKFLAEDAVEGPDGTVTNGYVAKVGSTYYETLEAAIAAASAGSTVTLLTDVDLTSYPAKGMHRIDISDTTIDLDGHKITASGRWGVLFEGTNATIKNGTMEAIDNSDAPGYQYGVYVWGRDDNTEMPDPAQKAEVTLEDLTINYGIHTYNAEVTVKNCNVTGSSKYYAIWADCESTVNVESGNFTTGGAAVVGTAQYQNTLFGHININDGNFVVPAGKKLVQTGSSCVPANTVISGGFYHYANGSVYTVPEINVATYYTQNMSSGQVIPDAVDTMSITVEDDIDLNIYLDDSTAVEDYYKINRVVYSYNATPDLERETIVTVETPAKRNKDGKVVLSIELAPAQIRDDITVQAYSESNTQVRDFTTSIADYCNTIIEGQFPENLKDLAKSTLDYGKGASNYFGYNTTEYSGYTIQLDDPTEEIDAVAATAAANKLDIEGLFTVTGVSYRATSKPEIRFYIDPTSVHEDQLSALNPYVESSIGKAYFAKQDDKFMLVIKNLDIVDFGKQFVVTIKDEFDSTYDRDIIEFTPITWVNAAIKSSDNNLKGLAKTIGNYYLKSVAYFGA